MTSPSLVALTVPTGSAIAAARAIGTAANRQPEPDRRDERDRRRRRPGRSAGFRSAGSGPAPPAGCPTATRRSRSRRGARRRGRRARRRGPPAGWPRASRSPASRSGSRSGTGRPPASRRRPPPRSRPGRRPRGRGTGWATSGTIASSTAAIRTTLQRPCTVGCSVAQPPAEPVADREGDEDDADRVRPDDRRGPEERRHQPHGGDLGTEACRCRPRRPARRGSGSVCVTAPSIRSRSAAPWPGVDGARRTRRIELHPALIGEVEQLLLLHTAVRGPEEQPGKQRQGHDTGLDHHQVSGGALVGLAPPVRVG